MLNHRRLIAAAGTIVAAGTIAVSGLTAASAASPAVSGTEHFQLVTAKNTTNNGPVIAYGLFNAGGKDKVTGSNTDTFVFSGGTFSVHHSNGKGSQHFDPRTCVGLINQHGTFSLSKGTGKFAGISGAGTYHLRIVLIAGRAGGKCTHKPIASQTIIQATAKVHL